MNLPNNGFLATRFGEDEPGSNFSGTKSKSIQPYSDVTKLRQKAEADIKAMAVQKGLTMDQVVTQLLCNSPSELRAYVISKGETPLNDKIALGLQAILLRGNEVATVASALGTDDETALENIEGAESQYINDDTADASNVLTPTVQAAVKIALDKASSLHAGDGTMASVLTGFRALAGKSSNFIQNVGSVRGPAGASNADGDVDWGDPDTWAAMDQTDGPDLAPASIGTTLAVIPTGAISSAPPSVAASFPTLATSAPNLPQASGDTSGGGVLNAISGLLGGINKLAVQTTTAANSTAGAAGAIKNAISNVGANSLSTYIQNNKGTIIFVFILLIVVIFAAIYAAKHKSQ